LGPLHGLPQYPLTGRRRRLAALALVLMLGPAPAPAAEPDWSYERDLRNRLLLLHPLVNYALHPDQRAAWDRQRLAGSALLATIGSVHTEELLIDAQWALNAELASGLRLRNDLAWLEARHLPFRRRDAWLGLEATVTAGFAGVFQVQPAYDKEDLDLRFGVLWVPDAGRTRYAQVLYVREDPVYAEKNPFGGAVEQPADGFDWLVRQESGRWTLSSAGRWRREFRREFPDPARSPGLARQSGRDNALDVRVAWTPGPRAAVEAELALHETAAAQVHRDGAYSHDYAGWLRHLALRGLLPLDEHWRLRAELHHATQRADATGWRAFGYRREETMAALFGEWRWNRRHQVEAGYLEARPQWRYAGEPASSGRADKISLAVRFGFAADAALLLALSHEVDLQRFGGFNVQVYSPF
jgi:hypothetical protein